MLVIRLFRIGKKNQPSFKIVVTDKRKPPRAGRFVEVVGSYNPLTKERIIKKERVQYWISHGAKPSDTCHNLFVREEILKVAKIPVHKKPKTKEKAEAGALPESSPKTPAEPTESLTESPKEAKK